MRLLNFILQSFVFFLCIEGVYAQNESYQGGDGKGDSYFKSNPIYLFGQPDGIYFGGNGRGDNFILTDINYLHGENSFYKGGSGKGDALITIIPMNFNGISSDVFYAGGDGRGDFNSNSNPLFFSGEPANIFFIGGDGRGDHLTACSEVFLNNTPSNILFTGGAGRGDHSALTNELLLNGQSHNVFYSGGAGRGDVTGFKSLASIGDGPVILILNLFIEGYYLGGGLMQAAFDPVNNPSLCDPVTLELHDAAFPFALTYSVSKIIATNGSVSYQLIPDVRGHSYYIALRHRNTLETWSASPILINSSNISYSFTGSLTQAFGNNMKNLGDGNFALYSGDISDASTGTIGLQDGFIESQDYADMENAVSLLLPGYNFQDITGDGIVESADYLIMENNVSSLIFSTRP